MRKCAIPWIRPLVLRSSSVLDWTPGRDVLDALDVGRCIEFEILPVSGYGLDIGCCKEKIKVVMVNCSMIWYQMRERKISKSIIESLLRYFFFCTTPTFEVTSVTSKIWSNSNTSICRHTNEISLSAFKMLVQVKNTSV